MSNKRNNNFMRSEMSPDSSVIDEYSVADSESGLTVDLDNVIKNNKKKIKSKKHQQLIDNLAAISNTLEMNSDDITSNDTESCTTNDTESYASNDDESNVSNDSEMVEQMSTIKCDIQKILSMMKSLSESNKQYCTQNKLLRQEVNELKDTVSRVTVSRCDDESMASYNTNRTGSSSMMTGTTGMTDLSGRSFGTGKTFCSVDDFQAFKKEIEGSLTKITNKLDNQVGTISNIMRPKPIQMYSF